MTANGDRTRRSLTRVFCVALGVWALWTSAAVALAPPGASWERAAGLAAAAGVGIGVALGRPPPSRVAAAVGVAGGAVVSWGYLEWATTGLAQGTMNGPFSMENPFGATAAAATALALVPSCDPDLRWPWRVGAGAAAAVAGQALLRSGSMGALVALGCGATVVVIGTWRYRASPSPRSRATGAGVAAATVVGIALAALGVGLAVSRFVATSPQQEATSGLGVDSENHASEHLEIWADAAEVWLDHPVWGAGPGRLPAVVRSLEDARSDLVEALAETGLVGALAWATAIACAAVAVAAAIVRRRGAGVLALAAATTVLGVYSLVDTTAVWPFVTGLLWASSGGLVAMVGAGPEHR